MQSFCLLFCLLLAAVAVPEETDFSHVIVVSGNGISNSSCWYGRETCTLELALEGAHHFNSSVMISIQPGQYNLSDNSYNSFESTRDIAIVGNVTSFASYVYSNHSSIVIRCLPGAGLSFLNVTSVKIQNVMFDQCGALHNSTSRDFMELKTRPYLEFRAALYLIFCRDLHISDIKIVKSIGTGMAIIDTSGNNTIENSEFSENKAFRTTNKMPGGGGVYIEFSHCIPGDMSCETGVSNIPLQYISNATYKIANCVFCNNSVSTGEFHLKYYLYRPGNNSFTFGKGGGLALIFKGSASSNYIEVESCNFKNNEAEIGGGMYISFADKSQNNIVNVALLNVTTNHCCKQSTLFPVHGSEGGGIAIYYLLDGNKTQNNSITFESCEFSNNLAYYGGGVSVTSTSVKEMIALTNTVNFDCCNFTKNIARTGSAIDVFHWFSITSTNTNGFTAVPRFHNCIFTNNGGIYDYTTKNKKGMTFATVFVHAIPTSFSGSTLFYNNSGSSIAVHATIVEFQMISETNFTKNRARIGGAMSILGNAWVVMNKGAKMVFNSNTATEKGGAIFAYQTEQYYSGYSHTCFLRYSDPYKEPHEWNCSFTFSDNYAYKKRNSIYTSSLLPCLWPSPHSNIQEDIHRAFCWKGWIYNNSTNCAGEILTSAASLTANNSTLSFFPSRPKLLEVKALDERGTDITDQTVLTAASSDESIDPSLLYVSNDTLAIKGDPCQPPCTPATISLEDFDTIAVYLELDISILSCPPGFVYNHSSKQCNCHESKSFGEFVHCDSESFQSYIYEGACISHCSDRHCNTSSLIASWCPFSSGYQKPGEKISLQLTKDFCMILKRNGTLCSKCIENYGIAAFHHTMECAPCKNSYKNWLQYFALELIPLTVFFIIVFIFHVGVTRASANAFIFFSQVVSLPTFFILLKTETKIFLQHNLNLSKALIHSLYIPYSMWALEIPFTVGTYFCLSTSLSGIHILALQYLSALYPLLLAGIVFGVIKLHENNCRAIVCLCRPLCILFARFRRTWRPTTSVIDAFATFIVLAYTKLIRVSLSLLARVHVVNVAGETVDYVMKYDPSAHFFQGNHIPFGILSILIFILLGLLPPIILLLYPFRWFQRFLNWSKLNSLALKTFVDAFQGCYKDGTDGTPDRRFFAGFYFLLKITIFTIYTFIDDRYIVFNYASIVYMVATLCFTTLQPYKQNFYNCLDATFMTLLAIISHQITYSIFNDIAVHYLPPYGWSLVYILMFVPSLYMVGFLVYKLATRSGLIKYCVSKCCKNRNIQWTHTSESLSDDVFPHRITNPQLYEDNSLAGKDKDKEDKQAEMQSPFRPRLHAMPNYGSL